MDTSHNLSLWTNDVIQNWISSGTKLNSGLSLDEILLAETNLSFKFPPDFIELYKKVDGFRDLDWNEHMFSLWPLEKIIEEYKLDDDKDFIGFCDYLIHSHSIGFLKDSFAVYKNYDRQNAIASNFQEAVTMINKGSDLIY